jgi:glutamate--cysteine ligase
MRGADAGPMPFLCALPALCFGLLYDTWALDGAWDIVKNWDSEAREALRAEAPRLGLSAKIGNRLLRDVARDVLALARHGLMHRVQHYAKQRDETMFLEPLEAVVAGKSQAENLIHLFKTRWNGSVDPAFSECVF